MDEKNKSIGSNQINDNKAAIKSITDKLGELVNSGGLRTPKNYDPITSLGLAAIQIGETCSKKKRLDNNGKAVKNNGKDVWDSIPVIETCTKQSVINSILFMLQGGFNPTRHGSFRSYADVLRFDVNYQGKTMIAKRDGEVVSSDAQVVFEDDDFDYKTVNGIHEILEHKQTLKSRSTPIDGAYCVVVFSDGRVVTEIMNIDELDAALAQNKTDNPAQKKFKAEMCRKTVKNRAHKPIIESMDDSPLFHDEESQDKALMDAQHEVKSVEYKEFEEVEKLKIEPTKEVSKVAKSKEVVKVKVSKIPETSKIEEADPF